MDQNGAFQLTDCSVERKVTYVTPIHIRAQIVSFKREEKAAEGQRC